MKKSEFKKFGEGITDILTSGSAQPIFLKVQLLKSKVKIVYGIYHGIGSTKGIDELIIRTGVGRDPARISIKDIASVDIADPNILVQNINTLKEIIDRMY